MRIYETIFIVKPDAPEEELEASIDQVTSTITEGGGTINNVDRWAGNGETSTGGRDCVPWGA